MTFKPSSTVIVVAAFALLQFTLVSMTFPLTELLSQVPLFHIDNAAHWYRITVAANLAETGNVVGYDPYFNAGTATGIAANPGAKVPALLAVLLSPALSAIQIWKLYAFAASCIAGVCVPVTLLSLRSSRRVAVAAGAFALLLWWVSIFRWYHTAGMVSFVLASYLTLPFAALVFRFLQGGGGFWRLAGIGLFGAAGLLVHPLFPLPVAFLTSAFLFANWRTLDLRRTAALLFVVPAISLAPNLYWLYLYFVAEPLTVTVPGIRHQAVVDWNLIWMELAGIWRGDAHGSKAYLLLALAAVMGNFSHDSRQTRQLVRIFSAAGIFWIAYAALGAAIEPLAKFTQPNRFAPVGYLMLVVPAGFGVSALIHWCANLMHAWRRRTAWAALALLALLAAVNANELRRELSWSNVGHYGAVPPEVAPAGPMTAFLLDWLARETTPAARVLFETSNGRVHDGYHVAGYLAYTADREFIGGAYVFHYFANFTDGFLFGYDIADLPHAEFAAYADLYNLGWVVAHSAQSKAYFDGVPWLTPLETSGILATYRIDRPHSFFEEGSGRIASRGHNGITLADVEGQSVVLRYHYMRGLKARPQVSLAPVFLKDDPNPFIRIDNPPGELTIYLD